ncbi:MAG: sulfurtransferase-like selenium metabolism protein YedF [Butyricicoccus sp.]
MIRVNAIGDTCPIPVVKTKQAIRELNGSGTVETMVDNEIAVQNLTKMAQQKGYAVHSEQLESNRFRVRMTIGEGAEIPDETEEDVCMDCTPAAKRNVVVAVGTNTMGGGSDELGATLLKGFLYALSQQDELPQTILFYNGGAALTCEGSQSLEDLQAMQEQGVEILTCGTCLNYYGLTEQLRVGEVTNMYVIAEKLTQASCVVKP